MGEEDTIEGTFHFSNVPPRTLLFEVSNAKIEIETIRAKQVKEFS